MRGRPPIRNPIGPSERHDGRGTVQKWLNLPSGTPVPCCHCGNPIQVGDAWEAWQFLAAHPVAYDEAMYGRVASYWMSVNLLQCAPYLLQTGEFDAKEASP